MILLMSNFILSSLFNCPTNHTHAFIQELCVVCMSEYYCYEITDRAIEAKRSSKAAQSLPSP